MSDPLLQALHDPGDPPVAPLPDRAAQLLREVQAPPRLAAHLRLVHDVARQLLDWLRQRYPTVPVDEQAVLFGAATHDIGKTIHVAELSGPGSAHEEAGRALLLSRGVPAALARFAGTHAAWTGPDITLDDRLVSLADKVWKNTRIPDLEDLVIAQLAGASGRPRWEEFLALDDLLTGIGHGADHRLAFQTRHSGPTLSGATATGSKPDVPPSQLPVT